MTKLGKAIIMRCNEAFGFLTIKIDALHEIEKQFNASYWELTMRCHHMGVWIV